MEMSRVDISRGPSAGIGHRGRAVANDGQIDVGSGAGVAVGAGVKEQYARHSGHLRCGGRNLPGTRSMAEIAAGFGLDNPGGREQRRRGVIIAEKRAQLPGHAFPYGA